MPIHTEYAGMPAETLVVWILITTVAGLVARQIAQGKPILGLWGDMAIGVVGAYATGAVMRRFDFDLSKSILAAQADIPSTVAIWVDVFVAAFVGALIIRILLRFAKT